MERVRDFFNVLSVGNQLCKTHIIESGGIEYQDIFMVEIIRLLYPESEVRDEGLYAITTYTPRIDYTEMMDCIRAKFSEDERLAQAVINEIKRLYSPLSTLARGCYLDKITTKHKKAKRYISMLLERYSQFANKFDTLCSDWGYGRPLSEKAEDNAQGIEISGIEPQQLATSPYYKLTEFINGGTDSIEHIIKYKQPRDNVKLLWKSAKGDALLFHDILGWTNPEINRCIQFRGGKKLSNSNRNKNGESPYLRQILQGLK